MTKRKDTPTTQVVDAILKAMKKKETIITTSSVLLALVCAFQLFLNWSPEPLFHREETPVTMSDLSQGGAKDFTGSIAGGDIPRLNSAEEFSEILSVDYVTAEPVGIVPTGIYSLKAWESHFNTRVHNGRTSTGSRRAEVRRSGFAVEEYYNQYYLLELPDHSYILAQIPQAAADALAKGERVTLPIGQKDGMLDTARRYLSAICGEYGADMDGVLYTFDNEWQEEHHFSLFMLRFGAAAALWLVLSIGLTLIGRKVFENW